jgi:hypothetical protein
VHILVDDRATVILNGVPVGTAIDGWTTPTYPQIPINLLNGPNLLQIAAINLAPGGAALMASVIRSDGVVLAHTDGTWTFTLP